MELLHVVEQHRHIACMAAGQRQCWAGLLVAKPSLIELLHAEEQHDHFVYIAAGQPHGSRWTRTEWPH